MYLLGRIFSFYIFIFFNTLKKFKTKYRNIGLSLSLFNEIFKLQNF